MTLVRIHRREMLHQQSMNEDVSTPHAAEEDPFGAIVKERDEAPRDEIFEGDDGAQDVVFDDGKNPIFRSQIKRAKKHYGKIISKKFADSQACLSTV